ncbi:MAG: metallophosphoesterase family protein [Bacilli bacterium]|nr:metallophosphoesterase family protein [Bacilli bacterium]
MYKIGLFTDVHGNDLALKLILKEIEKYNVDEIISLGDLIAIGPNSNEVLDIVTKLNNFSSIRGNHEKYYLFGFSNPLSCTESTHQDWVKESINPHHQSFIEGTRYQINKTIEGVKLCFMHYPLRSTEPVHYEYIVHNPEASDLDNLFKDVDADVICYGHEHISSFIKGKKLYLDVGSCGCPYPEKDITRGLILIIDNGKVEYIPLKLTYNSVEVVKDMYRKEMPERDFISKNFYLYKK